MKLEPRVAATWYHTPVLTRVAERTAAACPPAEVTTNRNTSLPPTRVLLRSKPSKLPLRLFCLKTMYSSPAAEGPQPAGTKGRNLNHAATRRLGGWRQSVLGARPEAVRPPWLRAR